VVRIVFDIDFGKLSGGDPALEQYIELAERPPFTLGESEVRPDKCAKASASLNH
jgi:hypothetical protein